MTDGDAQIDRLDEYMARLPHEMGWNYEMGEERYGDAWLDRDPEYLLDRMEEEFYEFRQAVEHYEDVDEAISELADVNNFGLMFLVRSMAEGHND